MPKRKYHNIGDDDDEESLEDAEDSDSDQDDFSEEEDETGARGRDNLHDARNNINSMDDDALFGMFKKIACNVVRQIVSDVGPTASGGRRNIQDHGNASNLRSNTSEIPKGRKTTTRLSVTYFSDVIDSLSESKKNVIREYGFGSLLEFSRCSIPIPFARWIADHVKINTADIVVNNCSIQLSPESVHDVLHVPIGGTRILKNDPEAGKSALLKVLKKSTLPKIKDFGDKLSEDGISDDELVRSFLIVARATFLCPSSSTFVSPYYVGPLIDIKKAKEWNWALLVFEWLMRKLKQYRKVMKKAARSSITLGGCLYYLCVVYLDHLNFAQRTVPPPIIPRIKVWKGDMIKVFSDLDCKGGHTFGERPIKDFQSTCYYKTSSTAPAESAACIPSNINTESFKLVVDQTVGKSFSAKVLDEIAAIYVKNASVVNVNQTEHVQTVMLDVIKYFYDISRRENSYDSNEHGVDVNDSNPLSENAQNDGNTRTGSHQSVDDYGNEGNYNAFGSGNMDYCDNNDGGGTNFPDAAATNNNVSEVNVPAPASDEAPTLVAKDTLDNAKDQATDPRMTTSAAETEVIPSNGTGSEVRPSSGADRQSKSVDTEILLSQSEDHHNVLRTTQGGSTTKKRKVSLKSDRVSQQSGNSVASRTRSRHSPTMSPAVESKFSMIDNPEGILRKRNSKKVVHQLQKSILGGQTPQSVPQGVEVNDTNGGADGNEDMHTDQVILRKRKKRKRLPFYDDDGFSVMDDEDNAAADELNNYDVARSTATTVAGCSTAAPTDYIFYNNVAFYNSYEDYDEALNNFLLSFYARSPRKSDSSSSSTPQSSSDKTCIEMVTISTSSHDDVDDGVVNQNCNESVRPCERESVEEASNPTTPLGQQTSGVKSASFDHLLTRDISSHKSRDLKSTCGKSVNDLDVSSEPAKRRCLGVSYDGKRLYEDSSWDPFYRLFGTPNVNDDNQPSGNEDAYANNVVSGSGMSYHHNSYSTPEPIPLVAVDAEKNFVVINSQDSPDVTIIGQDHFSSRTGGLITNCTSSPLVNQAVVASSGLPNQSCNNIPHVVVTERSQFQSALTKMSEMVNVMHDEAKATNFELCEKINFDLGSTSAGKMPRRRARRLQHPNSFYRDFKTNECTVRWFHTLKERLIYDSLLHLASDPMHAKKNIIDYGNVTVNLKEFAESMRRDSTCSVHPFVINAFCYKLFKEKHPTHSRKHYFFSTVGDYLMGHQCYNPKKLHDIAEKSFRFAHGIQDLRNCDMLYFPICHDEHWFLFVVDIRDGFFVFLDCYFDENSEYHQNVKDILVRNFVKAWDEFIKERYDFHRFSFHCADVPKQTIENFFRKADDGIFTMKFIELWDPCVNLLTKFTSSHIADMRIGYVNAMVLSRHNKLEDMKTLIQDYQTVIQAQRARNNNYG